MFINTLRKPGPRLDWLGDAMVRTAETGGLGLMRDLFVPLLFNEGWQAENRDNFLKPEAYEPVAETDGAILSRCGLAVIQADDGGQLTANITALMDDSDVIDDVPEFHLLASEELQSQYVDRVRNGLRIQADMSAKDPQLLQLPPPVAVERGLAQAPRTVKGVHSAGKGGELHVPPADSGKPR